MASALISGEFGSQTRESLASRIRPEPLQYHGGQVLHSSDSYTIYWDPIGSYRGDWKQLINGYFKDVGSASGALSDVFAVDTQYTEVKNKAIVGRASNSTTFRGSYTDTDAYPASGCNRTTEEVEGGGTITVPCLTDAQIRTELEKVIVSGALPGATGTPVYYILTPPNVNVCTENGTGGNCSDSNAALGHEPNGICGYHSVLNRAGAPPAPYAVQPWTAGDAGEYILDTNPLVTSEASPHQSVLDCQDGTQLEEPNQLEGLNPFGNYARGLADLIINDLSIEQSNIVVDPFLNGWYQNTSMVEQGDMCQRDFGPPPKESPPPPPTTNADSLTNEEINGDPYYVQWNFDSVGVTSGKGLSCWSGVSLDPHFTSPNPVNSGDVVAFDATESNITLNAHTANLPEDEPFADTVYAWNFGDGTPVVSGAKEASVFHSYTYGGTYPVTLTVTDSGGNSATFTEPITVVGPAQPGSNSGPGGGSPETKTSTTSNAVTGSGSSTPSSPTGKSSSPSVILAPFASERIVSSSLPAVIKHGLLARYSVNEQVAGHFEVILAAATAKALKIAGAPAKGLANGTPKSVVIAESILVTTKGGRSSVAIKFGKHVLAGLRKASKVTLMLRLVVRNASPEDPKTATALSSATLRR